MNDAPISELLVVLIKLAALQLRLGIIATEATWAFGQTFSQPNAVSDKLMQSISEEQIEAAARVIELKLIGGYELGFQCLLRTNFPVDVIREMAKAALEAATRSTE